jgi:hypothetical protein
MAQNPLDKEIEEFERRWAEVPEEDRPEPPGFEDERAEPEPQPTAAEEAERAAVQSPEGEEMSQSGVEEALVTIAVVLREIQQDLRQGLHVG